MDKKYIGKFISNIREEKKLTQEELANRLGVSKRKIQKIEKGKFKINSDVIIPLCNELKISIYEFLNGHRGNDKIDQKDAINILDDYEKSKTRRKIIQAIISVISVILCIFSCIWVYCNRDLAYELSGESESFSYNQLFFFRDDRTYIMLFGNHEIKNENISEEDISNVTFKCNERLIISSSDFLRGDVVERKGYDELFPDEVVKNINDWIVEITYRQDDVYKTEIIKLKNKNLNK